MEQLQDPKPKRKLHPRRPVRTHCTNWNQRAAVLPECWNGGKPYTILGLGGLCVYVYAADRMGRSQIRDCPCACLEILLPPTQHKETASEDLLRTADHPLATASDSWQLQRNHHCMNHPRAEPT